MNSEDGTTRLAAPFAPRGPIGNDRVRNIESIFRSIISCATWICFLSVARISIWSQFFQLVPTKSKYKLRKKSKEPFDWRIFQIKYFGLNWINEYFKEFDHDFGNAIY